MSTSKLKASLPSSTSQTPSVHRRQYGLLKAVVLGSVIWFLFHTLPRRLPVYRMPEYLKSSSVSCPQVEVLDPQRNSEIWKAIGEKISTDEFKTSAISWLSGAVQIPTESYDNMDPVGKDLRWEIFGEFHSYLLKAFPQLHATLKLAKVNTYGLLYEWPGSDKSLKPILLAAHQDVVPVESATVDQWTHPPYSGFYDGGRIWGRGSSDDKSGLIGVLSAVETLIDHGFTPTRTIVLAFGFDEEASGLEGASQLGKAMLEIYGQDSFALIIDEGGGFASQYGTMFATPAIAEKGYLDTRIEITTAGGHSSVPPSHTSIGILSALLTHIEDHPTPVHLSRGQPIYETLQCFAEHSKDLDPRLRALIKKSAHSNHALRAVGRILFENPIYKAMWGTTQAIDLINGGVKVNALPESAWAVVNHRIATTSSVAEVKERDTVILKHLADKFNLSYTAFGVDITEAGSTAGSLTLSDAWGTALEPAPVTLTSGKAAAPYKLLSGTIKATFNAHRGLEGDNILVAPGMSTGNTDTRYYWKLSRHIFRYNHKYTRTTNRLSGIHTVNESIDVDSFLEVIRFFNTLILNADESSLP